MALRFGEEDGLEILGKWIGAGIETTGRHIRQQKKYSTSLGCAVYTLREWNLSQLTTWKKSHTN